MARSPFTQAARYVRTADAVTKLNLVRRTRQLLEQQARAGMRQTVGPEAARFAADLGRAMRGGGGGMVARALAGAAAYDFANDVVRYARGGVMNALLRKALRSLGITGQVLQWLIGRGAEPQGVDERTVAEAVDMLRGLGFEVRIPTGGGRPLPVGQAVGGQTYIPRGQAIPRGTVATPPIEAPPVQQRTSGGAANGGRSSGGATPAGGAGTPGGPQIPPRQNTGGNGGQPPQGPGQGSNLPRGSFPGGLMIPMELCRSSNVYAYGYDAQTLTLRVQFLGSTINRDSLSGRESLTRGHRGRRRPRGVLGSTVLRDRRGPGPTYDYHGVPPRIFRALQGAASKGGAVWDHLRIRGTVYGHRFDYELVAAARVDVVVPIMTDSGRIAGNRVGQITYVPRRAAGPGQFQARRIQQGTSQFRSLLPSVGMRRRGT